jgi:hypothetical protein
MKIIRVKRTGDTLVWWYVSAKGEFVTDPSDARHVPDDEAERYLLTLSGHAPGWTIEAVEVPLPPSEKVVARPHDAPLYLDRPAPGYED